MSASATSMMKNPHRRLAAPMDLGPPNKRKERNGFNVSKPKKLPKPGSPSPSLKPPQPAPNNQLLAGYLAHEFLTKGTLFGQPFDPARAESVPVSATSPKRLISPYSSSQEPKAEPREENYQRYVEVAYLLKTDRVHIPGIVNPTQLDRFLEH
ncbi:uncharacterized protein LOC127797802 [Diospyros lotus]|uniref:uncharacterized protein LOC127797802 n=1 Tax=Diospyros lotus TaxID=55363 RepID=UPI002258DD46|nr:uncharacterized protein LOC127797802 [Diospyros lotus]XP_052186910.1 uncharacterized protein LOC127797802 [Diospyros lotus]XP_052186911.1 uncharacterized protein LOC127797802 [Diospyros lotus]